MAIRYTCDRCGRDINVLSTFTIRHKEYYSTLYMFGKMKWNINDWQLCAKCADEFREWINHPKQEVR